MEWNIVDYRPALHLVTNIFREYNMEIHSIIEDENNIEIVILSPHMVITLENGHIEFNNVPLIVAERIITSTNCVCYSFDDINCPVYINVGYKFLEGYDIEAVRYNDGKLYCTVYCDNDFIMSLLYDGIIHIIGCPMLNKSCVRKCIQSIYGIVVSINYYRELNHNPAVEIDDLFDEKGKFYQEKPFRPQYLD